MDNYLSPYELALRDSAVRKWLSDDSEDTEMRRLRLALQTAIREELTERERLYLAAYYLDRKTVVRIGKDYGVDKSTVSRGLSRARRKLERVLRYCSPRLLADNKGRRTNNREV